LAFPTLTDVTVSVVILLVGAPIVYLLSRALKLRPKPIAMADSRKEATMTFIVIVVVYVATTLLAIFDYVIFGPSLHLDRSSFGPVDALFQVPYYIGWLLPVVIVMRRTKQNRGSIGISRDNIGRMLALCLILSAIFIAVEGFLSPALGGGFTGFSPSLVMPSSSSH
jgi:hypothetical protein